MNKGTAARTKAYNAAYVEFNRKAVDNGEGIDEGILVPTHSFAAWLAEHNYGACKCNGSGTYWVRAEGFETHGKYVIERCFGCNGKGYQDRDDQKRNWGYWNFYARIDY